MHKRLFIIYLTWLAGGDRGGGEIKVRGMVKDDRKSTTLTSGEVVGWEAALGVMDHLLRHYYERLAFDGYGFVGVLHHACEADNSESLKAATLADRREIWDRCYWSRPGSIT